MTDLDAQIVAVTVYMDRARVTRRGVIHVAPGEHILTIRNVPRRIDPDSIRATGHGLGVRLLGVDLAKRYETETPNVDTLTLERQLQTLKDSETQLNDHDMAEQSQLKLLESLREASGARFAKALSTGKASVDSFRPLTQYLMDEEGLVQERRRQIAFQKRDLQKEIEAAQNRLNQAGATKSREWFDIAIEVEAASETDLELETVYVVTHCSWKPLYDVRLVDNAVTLAYLAQVTQESGEDWPAVELTLSTARPAKRMVLPKLEPWYLDKYVAPPPQPVHAMRQSLKGPSAPAPAAAYMEAGMPAAQSPEAFYESAVVESAGTAVTYRVARPVAIESNGSPHKTMVTTVSLTAKLDYVVIPKVAAEAYLRAVITNNSPLMLLPGQAQLFKGDEYTGAIRLPRTIAPGEEYETQLGIEDRIKVERELLERTTAKTLVGNIRRITIGYKLKLTNNLPQSIHVVVSDQFPVSKSEDIKVRLQDAQPKPTDQNDRNMLKWEFDMTPQSKREVTFTFVVESPRDLTVTGLGELEPAEQLA
ncbi:MAG TPA: mucoidy inhibitor MuiA family protein [Anaerolineae bacterium]|jgi:uncharacterized protein (TIGR02231 family)